MLELRRRTQREAARDPITEDRKITEKPLTILFSKKNRRQNNLTSLDKISVWK
jgi:hypothetical protein